jgi:hypothetical protein
MLCTPMSMLCRPMSMYVIHAVFHVYPAIHFMDIE